MSELKIYKQSDVMRGHWFTEYCRKDEADRVIAEKDKVIAELKSDIADLCDDKKSTDAILDERNAEIAELKAYKGDVTIPVYGTIADAEVYLKEKADEVIEELKTALNESEEARYEAGADAADYYQENRRLKRALYKACANWALSTLAWLDCIDQGEPRKWSEMRQKCLKKAEEYK